MDSLSGAKHETISSILVKQGTVLMLLRTLKEANRSSPSFPVVGTKYYKIDRVFVDRIILTS
jgi:hypothetical protein